MLNKLIKKLAICTSILFFACLNTPATYAQGGDGVGQTIQIYTQLNSFIGRPSWLIIIRDIDHNQNIPYLYDFDTEDNFWVALTYGRNYLVTTSELQFSPYREHPYRFYSNYFSERKINNFCHLESHGRILHGESMYIMLRGKLTPNPDTYTCSVSVAPSAN
jgi:hypothetical protein